MRSSLRALIYILILLPIAPTSADEVDLRVGVRADTIPFAFRGDSVAARADDSRFYGPIAEAGFSGYMALICDSVLREMQSRDRDLSIEVIPVSSFDRFDKLDSGEIDILCGPATLTVERARRYQASVPLYLTGVAYLERVEEALKAGKPNAAIVGMVGATTASKSLTAILSAGEFGIYSDVIRSVGVQEETSDLDSKECHVTDYEGVESSITAIRVFCSHREAAKSFCNNEVYYYVGDAEIISAQSDQFACDYRRSGRSYTADRYTILSRPQVGILEEIESLRSVQVFWRTFYEIIFGRQAISDAYEATFREYEPSKSLRQFYWSVFGLSIL